MQPKKRRTGDSPKGGYFPWRHKRARLEPRGILGAMPRGRGAMAGHRALIPKKLTGAMDAKSHTRDTLATTGGPQAESVRGAGRGRASRLIFRREDPRRLAIVRILLCPAMIALPWVSPLVAAALVFVMFGVAGRLFALAAGLLAAWLWVADGAAVPALQAILLLGALATLLFSRAWDAYSFDALWGLFIAGKGDQADLEERSGDGAYRWPVVLLALAALVYYGAVLIGLRWDWDWGWGLDSAGPRVAFHVWNAPWIVALAAPLHKAPAYLTRLLKRIYPISLRYVIYDGDCSFCKRTIMVVLRLDVFGLFDVIDFRRELDRLGPRYRRGLTKEQAEIEMYFSTRVRSYAGFHAFRAMAWDIPLFWPVVGLLYVPGATFFGVRAYKFVAENRMRIRLKNMDRCSEGLGGVTAGSET